MPIKVKLIDLIILSLSGKNSRGELIYEQIRSF